MSENTKVVKNAVCTFCGCVCDDMELTVDLDQKRITKAKNACVLGRAWFYEHTIENYPVALIDGKEASLEEAIDEAAKILVNAKFPAIYGLSDTTCEAQKEAVAIADYINGNIDTTTSVCHGPTGMAFQGIGESTASLGEIKNRADFVMYWGGNPAEAHPRHFQRYSVSPKGLHVPNGKEDRTIVMVDVRTTQSASVADIFLKVKPGRDFELLWALRALVKGAALDPSVEETTGIPLDTMKDLVERMKNCRFGVIFFGMGLTMTRGRHFNAGALLALTTDLNSYTHFVANPTRGHGNVTGADNVVSWQTGYPFGVSFNRGYPRFNPGEFTTADVLARGEIDALCVIASDPGSNFSKKAIEHLRTIPVITLDPKPTVTSQMARVAFTTATYGINVRGTVYRMDNVPLTTRPAFESPFPSDQEVLSAIKDRVCELRGLKQGGSRKTRQTAKVAV
ncbi:MAG: formylmethanofuran dehydrogenase subunit B [Gammaproteobacteria bacterium]